MRKFHIIAILATLASAEAEQGGRANLPNLGRKGRRLEGNDARAQNLLTRWRNAVNTAVAARGTPAPDEIEKPDAIEAEPIELPTSRFAVIEESGTQALTTSEYRALQDDEEEDQSSKEPDQSAQTTASPTTTAAADTDQTKNAEESDGETTPMPSEASSTEPPTGPTVPPTAEPQADPQPPVPDNGSSDQSPEKDEAASPVETTTPPSPPAEAESKDGKETKGPKEAKEKQGGEGMNDPRTGQELSDDPLENVNTSPTEPESHSSPPKKGSGPYNTSRNSWTPEIGMETPADQMSSLSTPEGREALMERLRNSNPTGPRQGIQNTQASPRTAGWVSYGQASGNPLARTWESPLNPLSRLPLPDVYMGSTWSGFVGPRPWLNRPNWGIANPDNWVPGLMAGASPFAPVPSLDMAIDLPGLGRFNLVPEPKTLTIRPPIEISSPWLGNTPLNPFRLNDIRLTIPQFFSPIPGPPPALLDMPHRGLLNPGLSYNPSSAQEFQEPARDQTQKRRKRTVPTAASTAAGPAAVKTPAATGSQSETLIRSVAAKTFACYDGEGCAPELTRALRYYGGDSDLSVLPIEQQLQVIYRGIDYMIADPGAWMMNMWSAEELLENRRMLVRSIRQMFNGVIECFNGSNGCSPELQRALGGPGNFDSLSPDARYSVLLRALTLGNDATFEFVRRGAYRSPAGLADKDESGAGDNSQSSSATGSKTDAGQGDTPSATSQDDKGQADGDSSAPSEAKGDTSQGGSQEKGSPQATAQDEQSGGKNAQAPSPPDDSEASNRAPAGDGLESSDTPDSPKADQLEGTKAPEGTTLNSETAAAKAPETAETPETSTPEDESAEHPSNSPLGTTAFAPQEATPSAESTPPAAAAAKSPQAAAAESPDDEVESTSAPTTASTLLTAPNDATTIPAPPPAADDADDMDLDGLLGGDFGELGKRRLEAEDEITQTERDAPLESAPVTGQAAPNRPLQNLLGKTFLGTFLNNRGRGWQAPPPPVEYKHDPDLEGMVSNRNPVGVIGQKPFLESTNAAVFTAMPSTDLAKQFLMGQDDLGVEEELIAAEAGEILESIVKDEPEVDTENVQVAAETMSDEEKELKELLAMDRTDRLVTLLSKLAPLIDSPALQSGALEMEQPRPVMPEAVPMWAPYPQYPPGMGLPYMPGPNPSEIQRIPAEAIPRMEYMGPMRPSPYMPPMYRPGPESEWMRF